MIAPTVLYYHTVYSQEQWIGQLDKPASFIVGGNEVATLKIPGFHCELRHGILTVNAGSQWDFATGAIDSEDMRIASLLHDAYCNMYNHKKIKFWQRRKADKLFRKVLEELGTNFIRRWYSYLAVSLVTYLRKK